MYVPSLAACWTERLTEGTVWEAAKAWNALKALYNLAACLLHSSVTLEYSTLNTMWSGSPLILASSAILVAGQNLTTCPGYSASNVQQNANGLTADLSLAGEACNAYGTDLPNLTLTVEYQSGELNRALEFYSNAASQPSPCDHPGPEPDCVSSTERDLPETRIFWKHFICRFRASILLYRVAIQFCSGKTRW